MDLLRPILLKRPKNSESREVGLDLPEEEQFPFHVIDERLLRSTGGLPITSAGAAHFNAKLLRFNDSLELVLWASFQDEENRLCCEWSPAVGHIDRLHHDRLPLPPEADLDRDLHD